MSSATTAVPAARPLRIALVAGEMSGDGLAAGLIEQIRARHPDADIAGIGGPAMRAAGCDTWFDASELAVMGLAEVLRHLPRLLKLRSAFRKRVLDWQPDVFVGIDAPDFNLPVEAWLKSHGIRTVHYVSPSVWAWREKRAARIGTSVDRVLCLFPMEPAIYAQHGVDARFVGHPMADAIAMDTPTAPARARLKLDNGIPVLAVLPGSRHGEIARLGEPFLAAAAALQAAMPTLHVLIPAANPACRAQLIPMLESAGLDDRRLTVLDGHARDAMEAATVVLLASGTATLETALVKRPMVVGYKVSAMTARIVRALGLLKVNRFALPNVLAEKDLAPELIQEQCTPFALTAAISQWFNHPERMASLQEDYRQLHERLRQDASARAAEAVLELATHR